MTKSEFDAEPVELVHICLLHLLHRPVVRRWAHREFGFPLRGSLSCRHLAVWLDVHEDTIRQWERDGLIHLRGSCRRMGLTTEVLDNLRNN